MEMGTFEGKFGFLVFLTVFVLLEALLITIFKRQGYPWKDSIASMVVGGLKRVVDFLTAGIAAAILFVAYEYRLLTLEIDNMGMLALCFLAVEFFYYWHHRWAHEIRWLWATHGVHHTAPYMNLSVAGRLGWTGLLSGSALFFAPLAVIGFHPVAIFIMLAVGLFYQIWIHTEFVGRLGVLEKIINTPSNHRVHHASNPEYLDKNYGGVLMIFDVIFGTYQKERDDIDIRYGTVQPVLSRNPFVITTFEWRNIINDVWKARKIVDRFKFMFGRPGWKPDRIKSDGLSESKFSH